MSYRCIKLDSAWKPVEIISWWAAFSLVYLEPFSCQILHEYPEKYKIRSAYQEWNYPAIIYLKNFVKQEKIRTNTKPKLKSILIRDLYTCQYCGKKLNLKEGTRDHVIPKSKKGEDSWNNLVAACKECQSKKKNYYMDEVNMYPMTQPSLPTNEERFINIIRTASTFERNIWKTGFKKLGMEKYTC